MRVVIDASATFVMMASPEKVAPSFDAASDVVAPELIVSEVLNARWKLMRAGTPAPSLQNVLGLFDRIRLVASLPYASDAAALAQRLDHPVYDCIYAAIAKREGAKFVTADRRFGRKLLEDETVDVVML